MCIDYERDPPRLQQNDADEVHPAQELTMPRMDESIPKVVDVFNSEGEWMAHAMSKSLGAPAVAPNMTPPPYLSGLESVHRTIALVSHAKRKRVEDSRIK